jgi:hypothetical protein
MSVKFYFYQSDKHDITPSWILLGGGTGRLVKEELMVLERVDKNEVGVTDIRVCAIKGKPADIIETLINPVYHNYQYIAAKDHDLYVTMDMPKDHKKQAPVVSVVGSVMAPILGALSGATNTHLGDYQTLAQKFLQGTVDAHGLLKGEHDKEWVVYIATSSNSKVVNNHDSRFILRHAGNHLPFASLALYLADWLGYSQKEISVLLEKMQRT